MREIKFRAWDGKKMIDTGTLHNTTRGSYEMWDGDNHEYHPIMQFTGLLDRNGKEIYEGDIVKTHPGTDKRIKFLDTIEKVEFRDGCFIVDGITAKGQWNELYKEINRIEIIGNIYENPELLK